MTRDLGDPSWGIQVTWHGHSCFSLKDSVGRVITIDPYDETVGYGVLSLRADALLITHDHFDHNARQLVHALRRDVDLVQSTGTHEVAGGVGIYGIQTSHDRVGGQVNGQNIVYVFSLGGLKIAHLGDLGADVLSPEVITSLKNCDVMFIPVGGVTTLNASQAKKLLNELTPKVVFPMHYGEHRFYPLDPVEKFTMLFSDESIVKQNGSMVHIRPVNHHEDMKIHVLKPSQNVD